MGAHLEVLAPCLCPDDGTMAQLGPCGFQLEYLPQELVFGGVDQGEDICAQHVLIFLQEACEGSRGHRKPSSAIPSDPQGKGRATGWGLQSPQNARRSPH